MAKRARNGAAEVPNDSGVPLTEVESRLAGAVEIMWGEVSLLVERPLADGWVARWRVESANLSAKERAERQEQLRLEIDAAMTQLTAGQRRGARPRKLKMDRLTEMLCVWRAMGVS